MTVYKSTQGVTNTVTIEPVTAFGETVVAQTIPKFQHDFRYNVNTEQWDFDLSTGTITEENEMFLAQTTASANTRARMTSKKPIRYNSGEGAGGRFTSVFSTGVAGSVQEIGMATLQNGFLIRYNGTSFVVTHRKSDRAKNAITSITRASTTATVTTTSPHGLTTGDVVCIQGDSTTSAYAYEGYIGCHFITVTGGSTFTYPVASTLTTPAVGVLTWDGITDTDYAQAAFTEDPLDGSGRSGMTIVPTNMNVWEIDYQYLGGGAIRIKVEDPETGRLFVCHKIKYANNNTVPSLNNPSLPFYAMVRNTTNTTNVTLRGASCEGFIQGVEIDPGIEHADQNTITGLTTEVAVFTLRNKISFVGKVNNARIKILGIDMVGEGTGTKPITFKVVKNTVLGGSPVFTDHSALTSIAQTEKAGTTLTGGEQLKIYTVSRNSSLSKDFGGDFPFELAPGEQVTVSATSSGSVDVTVTANWRDLI